MKVIYFLFLGSVLFLSACKSTTPYENHHERGYQAFKLGVPASANPYTHFYDRIKWLDGWIKASQESKEQ